MTTTVSPPAAATVRALVPKSLTKAAAREGSRFAIRGVNIQPGPHGKGYASVTDGRVLVVRMIEVHAGVGADGTPVPLGAELLEASGVKKGTIVPVEGFDGKEQRTSGAGRGVHMLELAKDKVTNLSTRGFTEPIEGSFPPVNMVLGDLMNEEYRFFGVDVGLLANAAAALGTDKVVIGLGRATKPLMLMGISTGSEFVEHGEASVGVVMPIALEEKIDQMKRFAAAIAEFISSTVRDDWKEEPAPVGAIAKDPHEDDDETEEGGEAMAGDGLGDEVRALVQKWSPAAAQAA